MKSHPGPSSPSTVTMPRAPHPVSRIKAITGFPWWLAQLFTGAKSFKDNPLIGSHRLNRWGLHALRVRVAHSLAARRRRRMEARIAPEHRAAFARDGFVRVDNVLPEAEFEALRDRLFAAEMPAREMLQGDTITRRIAIDPELLGAVPALRALLASPLWSGLTRYVASFDSEPVHYIQTILTHRADAPLDPQTHLHADTFHPTMKAWYFLTDVAEDEGPFCYVPGSHRITPERLAWEKAKSEAAPHGIDHLSARGSLRITPDEVAALGLPPAQSFAVPANTLIVADTFGFHARGLAARPSCRIEIWAYGRRNPFLPWKGLDPLSLPGIAERRVGWMWFARDRFEKWIGQPWKSRGRMKPGSS